MATKKTVTKKVTTITKRTKTVKTKKLQNGFKVGNDEDAFSILGRFRRQAKRENWTDAEIKQVLDEAREDDYNHLKKTIRSYVTE